MQINKISKRQTSLVLIVLVVTLLIARFVFLSVYLNEVSLLGGIVGHIFFVLIFSLLVYVGVNDFFDMEIPDKTSLVLLLGLLVLNIVGFAMVGSQGSVDIAGVLFYPFSNLQLALVLGGISFLIVFLSKEKLMGEGDIRMFLIAGLAVGFIRALIFFYIMTFGGLLYGVLLGVKQKKFNGVKVPLGSFIVLGIILSVFL